VPPNITIALYTGNLLIDRGLAHHAPNPAGLAVSRDLMFALGLVDQPAQVAGAETDEGRSRDG
jgi:hypothetical protein